MQHVCTHGWSTNDNEGCVCQATEKRKIKHHIHTHEEANSTDQIRPSQRFSAKYARNCSPENTIYTDMKKLIKGVEKHFCKLCGKKIHGDSLKSHVATNHKGRN